MRLVIKLRPRSFSFLIFVGFRLKRQAVYANGGLLGEKRITIKDAKVGKKVKSREEVLKEMIWTLGKLGLIMGYFVLCDRTDFFMKENKYYSQLNFFVPLLYIFLVGVFFSEKSDQVTKL